MTTITADHKSIINCSTSNVLQLFPLKYEFAWEFFLSANKNHWTPNDIEMGPDIVCWNDKDLPMAYRHRFESVFAQLTTFDIQRGFDLAEALVPLIDAPELKMYLLRQSYEEMLHTWSYQYCIENLNLDQERIYNLYLNEPALGDRVAYAQQYSDLIQEMTREDLETAYGKRTLLKSLIFWFAIFEGIWFALNLAGPVQSMTRARKFTQTAEQFKYILRDENLHINFGIQLINAFRAEHPEIWTKEFEDEILEIFTESVELERQFIAYACRYQSVDYNVSDHMEMVYFYANKRLHSLGIERDLYPGAKCSMPWLHEIVNSQMEKNFFETRVVDYQKGAINLTEIQSGIDTDWNEEL